MMIDIYDQQLCYSKRNETNDEESGWKCTFKKKVKCNVYVICKFCVKYNRIHQRQNVFAS